MLRTGPPTVRAGPRRQAREGLIPRHGPDADTGDLPADYQKIMEIIEGGGGPLQARDVAHQLGLDAVPAKVEAVRGKLRKLAERGWITRTPAGRYLPR